MYLILMKVIGGIFIYGIFSLNAWAIDEDKDRPGLTINAKIYHTSRVANKEISITKVGERYIFMPAAFDSNGGFYGVYESRASYFSRLMAYAPYEHGLWDADISTGMYFNINGAVLDILSYTESVIPDLPFPWVPLSVGVVYNQVRFRPAEYPNYTGKKGGNLRGVQTVRSGNEVANSLLAGVPVKFVTIDTISKNDTFNSTYDAPALLHSQLNQGVVVREVTFSPAPVNEIATYGNGKVVINSKGVISSAPAGCILEPNGNGFFCSLGIGNVPAVFSFKALYGLAFSTTADSAALFYSVAGGGADVYVYYPAKVIENILGNSTTKFTDAIEHISMGIAANTLTAPLELFSSLNIYRSNNFAVSIAEVKTVGGNKGIVGQSDITIPYVIKQSGDSKATSVKVTVTGDTPASKSGAYYCGFNTNLNDPNSNQIIAVPLRLDVYNKNNPSAKKSMDSDCRASAMEIADEDWFDTSVTGIYRGELALDMVFDLNHSVVQSDIDGQNWQGEATGTGSISVEAIWS